MSKRWSEGQPVHVEQFKSGERNFAYLVADTATGDALAIDVPCSPEALVASASRQQFTLRYLFSTHAHADHTCGNAQMASLTGLRPLLYGTTCPRTGIVVADGAIFPLGSLFVCIIHTPGHTPDSFSLLVEGAVFTGDTLFVGKVGGTATEHDARQEYDSLHGRLMVLPDETVLYPGHDYGISPTSTIGRERKENPFLLQPDCKSFLDLKLHWATYKREHGIA